MRHSHQTICALQRPAFEPLFHGTTYFRFFHSNLHKIPSNDVSAIKYYSFDMFLSMCRGLGTKKGQSLVNSDRDTHFYRSFCACTNVPFLMNSDRYTFVQLFLRLYKCVFLDEFGQRYTFVQLFLRLYKCVFLDEFGQRYTFVQLFLRLYKGVFLDEFGQRYTFVQLFLHLYKCVFQMYFAFFQLKLDKIPSIYI